MTEQHPPHNPADPPNVLLTEEQYAQFIQALNQFVQVFQRAASEAIGAFAALTTEILDRLPERFEDEEVPADGSGSTPRQLARDLGDVIAGRMEYPKNWRA